MIYSRLNPEKALIWRIVHRDNLPWILDNGLHCTNADQTAPRHVALGNADGIDKCRSRQVPVAPGGVLADYVPFYFTPFSLLMKNIHSGWSVQRRDNDEVVILVASLRRIAQLGLPFVYTNAHAYPAWTHYYNDLVDLDQIDWPLLQHRDFTRDPNDPRKVERYQAEALIQHHLPVTALQGIICHSEAMKERIEREVTSRDLVLPVHARPGWYFQ
jgi:hypothetical protein